VFLRVHQRVVDFLRRRVDEHPVFDVFRFHGFCNWRFEQPM
jgi:hypothetical protein